MWDGEKKFRTPTENFSLKVSKNSWSFSKELQKNSLRTRKNQFWEHQFLSNLVFTELRASLLAQESAYVFL